PSGSLRSCSFCRTTLHSVGFRDFSLPTGSEPARMRGMKSATPDLLEATVRHLRELLSKLEADRVTLDAHISEVRSHIAQLEDEGSVGTNGVHRRARKGENARAVADLYDATPDGAWTKQEIAEKTGLPFSSVQAILGKDDRYVQGPDGLW